jgi:hypothetical protein
MGNTITTTEQTRELESHHRVLMLGDLAVIAYGHSRPAHDADIWLDPGTRVLDVLVTKQATDRDKNTNCIAFLEAKATREYLVRLPTPSAAEAAQNHPEESVRTLSLGCLMVVAE